MTERGCSDGVQATRRATSREDDGGHESERRDPAAGDRCEEVHRGDVQVPGPGLAGPEEEEEPSRTRTQAADHPGEPAILYIYIEREGGSKRVVRSWWSWETEASTLRTHGLGHHCPLPPPTHIHTTSSKSESSLPPASCLGGGRDPPPCTGKTLADHTTVVTCFFLLLFFVLSCRSRRRG